MSVQVTTDVHQYDDGSGSREQTIIAIAIENVEMLIAGMLTDPADGTLAARVLAWANERATWHVPIVTMTLLEPAPL